VYWCHECQTEKQAVAASESRAAQAQKLAEHKLKVKLFRQLRRARPQYLRGKSTTAAIVRRARVVEEFKKQVGDDVSPFYSSDNRLQKSVAGLRERMTRAEPQCRRCSSINRSRRSNRRCSTRSRLP
jgi:hypothetical protein